MREFSKFSPRFWINAKTKQLTDHSPEAILVAVYLQTSHHSHSTGVFFLPLIYIARDTGVKLEKVKKIIDYLCETKYCHYDYTHEYIWIVGYGLEQTGGPLKIADKRTAQIQRYYEQLPPLSFLGAFYETHQQDFHLITPSRGDPDEECSISLSLEAPSMVLRSKEKEKEKEKNKETEKDNIIVEQARPSDVGSTADIVFDHWKLTMSHPQAKLDLKRKQIIKQALQAGYSVDELCQAISGCAVTPHNMGDNDRGQRYVGLHVIFKNGDQIDRFISNFHSPPKKKPETLLEKNQTAMDIWLKQKQSEQEELQHVGN